MKNFKEPSKPAPTVTESMMKQCLPNIENTHDELFGVPTLSQLDMEGII